MPDADRSISPGVDFRRAQVYGFLSLAFLYPQEDWTVDTALVAEIVSGLEGRPLTLDLEPVELTELQRRYRTAFGLAGPLCYETEFGLPHEYRQSQELADLSGFYRAYGFSLGGAVRERPDHLAAELEFMHVLALKAFLAATRGEAERTELCVQAQRTFLADHLGRWVDPFARLLELRSQCRPYPALARFAADFIRTDSSRLGASPAGPELNRPTPFEPEFSCAGCPVYPR